MDAEMVGQNNLAKAAGRGGIDSTNPVPVPPTVTSTVNPIPTAIAAAPITSAETARHLLSPSTPTRPRSSTVNSHTSAASTGYESSSSEDSMLSFWSDDDDSGDEESMTEPEGPNSAEKEEREEKKEEKKKREEDRSKVLEQAGLKLRREAPGIPTSRNRRRAPDAPGSKKRRAAPGLPLSKADSSSQSGATGGGDGDKGDEGKLDTLDAYARYEDYLAQSQAQANLPRPTQPTRPTSPPSPSPSSTRPARSTSIISQPSSTSTTGGGGRFSGLISRIMAPSSSDGQAQPQRKSISIVRVESDQGGNSGSGEKERGGGTWTSLVDPSVLGTMSDVERKRQEVSLIINARVGDQSVSSLRFLRPLHHVVQSE